MPVAQSVLIGDAPLRISAFASNGLLRHLGVPFLFRLLSVHLAFNWLLFTIFKSFAPHFASRAINSTPKKKKAHKRAAAGHLY